LGGWGHGGGGGVGVWSFGRLGAVLPFEFTATSMRRGLRSTTLPPAPNPWPGMQGKETPKPLLKASSSKKSAAQLKVDVLEKVGAWGGVGGWVGGWEREPGGGGTGGSVCVQTRTTAELLSGARAQRSQAHHLQPIHAPFNCGSEVAGWPGGRPVASCGVARAVPVWAAWRFFLPCSTVTV
jgi:hypothetical protein